MTAELTIAGLVGVEAEIYSVIARAVELRMAGDPQASFDLLTQSEVLVELVSITRQGRFHNQRALALKDLREYDRAILEFDRAAYCFEESGEADLQAMVHSNIGGLYSLVGNHDRARESLNIALRLVKDRAYRVQIGDQLANALRREGKYAEAESESNRALGLAIKVERLDLIAECLATKSRIAHQKDGTCDTITEMVNGQSPDIAQGSQTPSKRGGDVLSTPLEYAQTILRQNYDAAEPLFRLLASIADPNGDPARYSDAWEAMRYVNSRTPRAEAELQSLIDESRDTPQEITDVSS